MSDTTSANATIGGCCGSAAEPAQADRAPEPVAPCCGTIAEAVQGDTCCGAAAKQQAVDAGQACCG